MKARGKKLEIICIAFMLSVISACEVLDNDHQQHAEPESHIELNDVAEILAALPLEHMHLKEVHNAVSSSIENGYDEEYTMSHIFDSPGSGVGDDPLTETRARELYPSPLRELIKNEVINSSLTKSSGTNIANPQEWLDNLTRSDVQIYWPYSENWDGESYPIITFDPEDDSDVNVGYRIIDDGEGARKVEEIIVDEDIAMEEPVWVVNRNSDAGYKTLEMLRKEHPDWGNGGGDLIIDPTLSNGQTKANGEKRKALVLKTFTMHENYDTWFAGASEFFIKIGSVKDFTASTEAELKLFNPAITDVMVVAKRNSLHWPINVNTVLMTDWTDQLTHCVLMVYEDDGGFVSDWNCTALVRIASKSYGVELNIPFRSFDDIVWRGRLSREWLEYSSNRIGKFGNVDIVFELVEY